MPRYQLWDKISDVYTPSGERFTADQWKNRYSWVIPDGAKMILSGGPINGALCEIFDNFVIMRLQQAQSMGIELVDTSEMTDAQLVDYIEDLEDMMQELVIQDNSQPSTEERIAAALEYQVMNSLPDEETL